MYPPDDGTRAGGPKRANPLVARQSRKYLSGPSLDVAKQDSASSQGPESRSAENTKSMATATVESLDTRIGGLSLEGSAGTSGSYASRAPESNRRSGPGDRYSSRNQGRSRNPAAVTTSSQTRLPPNFGNDYSSHYVRTGILPQKNVQNIKDPLIGYPRLQSLHQIKAEHVRAHARAPIGLQCEPHNLPVQLASLAAQGAQFDVIMVHGCTAMSPVEDLLQLPVPALTPRPSLLFLWVPSMRLGEGRKIMDAWGFRRAEDIVYIVSSETSVHAPDTSDWDATERVFRGTTWHCLMGIKGTLRRSDDTALINCNVDTDVIIEKLGSRANIVPEEIYLLVENFTNMSRRLHIVPTNTPESLPVRMRPGWAIISPDILISNLDATLYRGRQVVPVHPQVDILRPRTPVRLDTRYRREST